MSSMDPDTGTPRPSLSVTIVVPTRNEAGNIEEFCKRTSLALRDRAINWEILFADDSDDNTPGVIEDLAQKGQPVRCVHRPVAERHNSIGGAVKAALPHVHTDFVAIIDADLQHPPEILPALIGPLWSGTADFVVGTRYGPGGSAEGLGSSWRRGASRSSALFTKLLFPQFWHCTDLASGMFAFRLGDFNPDLAYSTGFKWLVEAMVRCQTTRPAEIAYSFEERVDGLSKARLADGITLIRQMLRLRRTTKRFRPLPVVKTRQEIGLTGV